MDVKILVTHPKDEHPTETQRKQSRKNVGNEDPDFPQMPTTIRDALDEIKNPQAQNAYKPTEKKPWVYHGTRRRHFNSNTYSTFSIRLISLQNLRTKSTESTGDYMVTVFFKGRAQGKFLSGAVDLESLTALTRHKKRSPAYLHCPKVTLDHKVKLHLRFKDMVDNPIVLALTSAGDNSRDITLLEPFAYTSLNIINLVRKGEPKQLLRPWYCVQGKTPKQNLLGFPFIDLEVSSFGGLPNPQQLKQGNIMTVVVESMYRLPPEIQNMTNQPNNEMEVFITLPHSSNDNVLQFPAGVLEKIIPPLIAEIFDKSNLNDEEEKEDKDNSLATGSKVKLQSPNQANGIPVFLEQPQGAHRHWASIPLYYPDIPRGASVVTGKKRIIKLTSDKYCLAGDVSETGDTSWKGYLSSSDTRLVWNSLHRHYMSLEAYKQMLERLAKQVIWPLEIAITVRKEKEHTARKLNSNSVILKKMDSNSKKGQNSENEGVNNFEDEPQLQHELVVIYHGVAFIDMTKLLHPGAKRAHYACRLYTFDEAVFMASTCAIKSAFLSTLNKNIDLVIEDRRSETEGPTKFEKESGSKSLAEGSSMIEKKQRKSDAAVTKKDVFVKPSSPVEGKLGKKQQKKPSVTIVGSGEETVRVTSLDDSGNFPFIVFQIRMNRSLVPPLSHKDKVAVQKCVNDYLPMRRFARKRTLNSTLAQKKYRQSVLEAAAELSHQFHSEYLDYIVKEGVSRAYLDPRSPASSFDNIKKGFLFYLNASGQYLVLREHLRHAVSNIIQQKCTNVQPKGFKSRREFQNFLHDMYLYLVDEMHKALNETALQEVDPLVREKAKVFKEAKTSKRQGSITQGNNKCTSSHSKKQWVEIQNLLMNAEEAFLQSDFENAHRLHVQRVARSGEDSETWADFAIMWLGRGDDRLAQIATRESLIKNEKNIKALIISGVTAARHKEQRAITCLGAALRLRPISPEILVLIGAAHSCLGNDVASEYFFKKARFVHHLLTGKDTTTISQEFGTVSASWDLVEAVASLDKAIPSRRLTIRADSHSQAGDLDVEKEKNSTASEEKDKFNRKKSKTITNKQKDVNEGEGSGLQVHPPPTSEEKQKKTTLTPFTQRPQYGFPVEELVIKNRRAIKFANLPSMGPSIIHVWNVTKLTKRLTKPKAKSISMPENSQATAAAASVAKINESLRSINRAPVETHWREIGDLDNLDFEDESGVRNKGTFKEYPEEYLGEQDESDPEVEEDGFAGAESQDNTTNKSKKRRKVISRRTGSEYIWTAHLLLKLRLFDFLDGILARELAFNEGRGVPFLYIRALSLHLRQRDLEALELIEEALHLNGSNPILWALRGHCYYNLHDIEPAMQCYERALKLPHGHENMQLVYLRFGSLCLEKGNVRLAKKIFLKGVHSFPSPYMWMATGNICYHLKEYSQAETAFAEANRLDNTNPVIWAHLSLVSLAKGHKTLAEQSYKWAIRFGLKKCRLMDEIKELHRKKGFGNPGFPKIPHCIPHEYYLNRLGRDRPFEEYKDALKFPKPKQKKNKYSNTHRENDLIKKLQRKQELNEKLEFVKEEERRAQLEAAQAVQSDPQPVNPIHQEVPQTLGQKTSLKGLPHELKQGKKVKNEGKTRIPRSGSTGRRKSSQIQK